MIIDQGHAFFWSGKDLLSNFYPSPCSFGEYTFENAEQLFHAYKALFFKDQETFELILNEPDPQRAKQLGRQVKGFSQELWNAASPIGMYKTLIAKYHDNPDLKKRLVETDDLVLVEASPFDRTWGIGFRAEDALQHKDQWGENRLGKLHMVLRQAYR